MTGLQEPARAPRAAQFERIEPVGTAGPRTISVLHVISGLFYGGGQRVVLDLLKSLPNAGPVKPRLYTLGRFAGSPLESRTDRFIPYDGRYNNPRVLFGAARRLRRLITDEPVDLVHTHGLDADLVGGLALWGRPEWHICHLHITPPVDRRESWKARVRRRLFTLINVRRRTRFIAVAGAVRETMAKYYRLPPDRIDTVLNGIDLEGFDIDRASETRSDAGRVVFGTATRLAPMKGIEQLIQAAARLRDEAIHVEFRIAGGGSRRDRMENLARSLDVDDRVRFLGPLAPSEMPAFYRSLDAFVLASASEGLPLVVLEAMASGRPVLATRVGGMSDALEHGEHGLIVPPGDVDALSAAIATLAGSRELRQRMGAAGRERAQSHFGLDRVARDVLRIYERVLGHPVRRSDDQELSNRNP